MVDAVMAISYWSSLWSSLELGDRKWRLNHNGEIMETSYGDQNFIQYKSGEYISGAFQGYKRIRCSMCHELETSTPSKSLRR